MCYNRIGLQIGHSDQALADVREQHDRSSFVGVVFDACFDICAKKPYTFKPFLAPGPRYISGTNLSWFGVWASSREPGATVSVQG